MKELKFIEYISKKFSAKKPVIKGIGDDCAVMSYAKDKHLLLTCDMIIEGTHFSQNTSPQKIAWKAMAVNISDIAAMGGVPKYALISCGIPKTKNIKFLKRLTKGIEKIAKKFNITVIGGDTNTSQKIVLNVTLIGEVEKKHIAKRSGAKEKDLIFMTGALGEGKKKHLSFTPRLKEGRTLVKNFKINSMIDLSDGLAVDINRLASSSKVGVRIYKSLIPLSEKSESLKKSIEAGEDFELLFTASETESKKIAKKIGEHLPVTLIGEVVNKRFGVKLIEEEGKESILKPRGFKHL